MATSVAEQIAVKVKTRLGLISTAAGYENTVSSVERPARIGTFQPKNYQLVLGQGNLELNEEIGYPGNPPALGWNQVFIIKAVLRQSENDSTANDTLKNQFTADVHKALTTVGSGDWAQWDGLAINTTLGTAEPYQDESESGFGLEVKVMFRTTEGDLTESR